MVFTKNRESVSLLGIIPEDHLVLIDESSFGRFLLTTLRALWQVRRAQIDTVVDLELFSRFTALLSYFSGARHRVGFHNYTAEGLFRGNFLTHQVFYNPHQHMELNFLALVCALSADATDVPELKMDVRPYRKALPRHTPSREERDALWELMRSANPSLGSDARFLVLNPDPGDALPIRGWPLDRFVQITSQLLAFNPKLFCVVIGLARSKPYAKALQRGVGTERVVDLTGRTRSLREVVTLFTLSDLVITNDSGPAHFAALTDVPSIALFGPETPALYGALGEAKVNLWAQYSCSPCLSAHNHRHTLCKDNKCLQAIEVAQVLAAAQELLARPGSPSSLDQASR
jgi:ADP-heptose:LPS heptosyltransferase